MASPDRRPWVIGRSGQAGGGEISKTKSSTTTNRKAVEKLWKNFGKAAGKLWKSCRKAAEKLWKSCAKAVEKL